MQSYASPAWSVRKAGLRVKPTFNAAYTNPRMKSNHPGGSFEAAIFPASFTCILYCNWESPTQEPAWRNWRWWHCSPGCWCHVLSTEIHRLRRLCTSQGKYPRSVLRPTLPARWDHADEQNAYARLIKVTVPSRLTVLSFYSNIAQQNCIFHDDFLSNAEPSRASSEKTSWCTTTRRSRIWFRIWFLPEHQSDSERKDTSAKMRSKLPTQALPSKFSFHPKNRVRPPLQKMPTCVPKEKNTRKALESTGWSQYSRRTVLALQKYFSKWRCTKSNPKSRPPLPPSRSFLFWESKSKPAQALPMLSKNFQGLWQIASPRLKKAFSNVESDLRFQFPMLFLLSFISRVTNYVC